MIGLNSINTVDEYGVGYGGAINTAPTLPPTTQKGIILDPNRPGGMEIPIDPNGSIFDNNIFGDKPNKPNKPNEPNKPPTTTDEPNMTWKEWQEWLQQEQQKLWDREDKIRKETQEREDNAYQRSIKDMIASGINPNLAGANPASSGGGITQASKKDYSPYEKQADRALKEILQAIEHGFKGSENDKDRLLKGLETLLGFGFRIFGK